MSTHHLAQYQELSSVEDSPARSWESRRQSVTKPPVTNTLFVFGNILQINWCLLTSRAVIVELEDMPMAGH